METTTPPPTAAEDYPVERTMPVDADGNAVAATIVVYASGLAQLVAYYATCDQCPARFPFFSPAERDTWAEIHRTENTTHPVELTVEPWNFMRPPWVAAEGQPLGTPRSVAVTFPLPQYDEATLATITGRRDRFKAGCPRHPDLPQAQRELTFSKELLVGATADAMFLSASFLYADGCFMTTKLDDADAALAFAVTD